MVYVFYDRFLKRLRQTLDDPHQNPQYLRCPRCGEPWAGLMRHLILHHKLSHAEARKVYAEAEPYGEAFRAKQQQRENFGGWLAEYLAYLESQAKSKGVRENA